MCSSTPSSPSEREGREGSYCARNVGDGGADADCDELAAGILASAALVSELPELIAVLEDTGRGWYESHDRAASSCSALRRVTSCDMRETSGRCGLSKTGECDALRAALWKAPFSAGGVLRDLGVAGLPELLAMARSTDGCEAHRMLDRLWLLEVLRTMPSGERRSRRKSLGTNTDCGGESCCTDMAVRASALSVAAWVMHG